MFPVVAANKERVRNFDGPRPNIVAIFVGAAPALAGMAMLIVTQNPLWFISGIVVGLILMQSPKIAKQWERGVVPFIDTVSSWIDQRVITTSFAAEQTLTSDTVPVNVDAVLFWMVYDAEKAALEVQQYQEAVSWAAQTALRDIIGRTSLSDLLRGREKIEEQLQELIDSRCNPWGVTVQSVEMRDVIIPDALQDAMSREAQAAREKAARIILGEAEVEIAKLFQAASVSYHDNPTALHLRAMNMLYEGLKEKGAMMIVPSTAVESMGMGGLMGMAAMAQRQLTDSAPPAETA
jgi:regulator of protease activity HflC (stomatin/prohibitin superfamily)